MDRLVFGVAFCEEINAGLWVDLFFIVTNN